MDDVLRLRKRLMRELDEKHVHDLRVALRRCRTVAQGMRIRDDRGRWRKLDRQSRAVLHALGALRDAQVLAEVAARTGPRNASLCDRVLLELRRETKQQDTETAGRALRAFDVTAWRRLRRRTSSDIAIRAMTRDQARRIVLRRWIDVADAHEIAIRAATPEAWHAARIAWKELRYSLEAFAPDLHQRLDEEMSALQTALGELHDLDSLTAFVRQHARTRDRIALSRWVATIDVNRRSQIAQYRRLTRAPGFMVHLTNLQVGVF